MGGKTQLQLEKEDKERDAAFNKAMHGKTAGQANSVATILFKNPEAKQAALDAYFKHFDNKRAENETDADRKARTDEYATLTRHYYNLATDIYEFGWGQSFHFCRFSVGEPFYQAIARHEHYLAHQVGIQEGMQVLDVGCGVGGPAREIAKFTGANITGLNNNDYQIDRAIHYAEKEKLAKQLTYVKGDFMQMPFPDNTFDAVYAIEATVHAPKLEGVYSEIFRVLKPGGVFGVYEWLMTDNYDNDNAEHRKIRLAIELGNGISNMVPIQEGLDAMKASGFDLLKNEDLAQRPDPMPWYWPLSGELKYLQSAGDFFTIFRMTKFGQFFTHGFAGLMETLRIAPKGTQKTANALSEGADGLVAGARLNLFTPMYLMVGRKPSN